MNSLSNLKTDVLLLTQRQWKQIYLQNLLFHMMPNVSVQNVVLILQSEEELYSNWMQQNRQSLTKNTKTCKTSEKITIITAGYVYNQ